MKLFGIELSLKRATEPDPSLGQLLNERPTAYLGRGVRSMGISRQRHLSGASDKSRLQPYTEPPRYQAGRRASMETNDTWNVNNFFNFWTRSKKTIKSSLQSTFDLDSLTTMDLDDLVELIGEISPEVSKALWDFLLMCNPGYECKAYKPGTEDIDETAQDALDAIMDKLAGYHGTVGVFFDRIFKMIFFRGSFLMELVLADNGYDFIDIATPDTKTLSYRRVNDPDRGQTWTFGQKQNGKFVDLNKPNIRYIPIHPNPDSIEGTSLCTAALFVSIFLMAVLRDTKRVVQHQGYMRLDVEVDFDALRDTMPEDVAGNPTKIKEWMNKIIDDVEQVYAKLDPDDTYIHGSTVKVNKPVGTVTADSLSAIDSLFQVCERMACRSLKTIPLLLGTNQSRSETQANREWEIYAKGIESIQHPVESGFEDEAEQALMAQGILATVKMRFHQFRAAEAMRDEQVEYMKLKKARFAWDCGYISQDEAAEMGMGKQKADAPEPRNLMMAADSFGLGSSGDDPEPGAGRKRLPLGRKDAMALLDDIFNVRQPTFAEVDDAEDFWKNYAPDSAEALIDADVAEIEEEQ